MSISFILLPKLSILESVVNKIYKKKKKNCSEELLQVIIIN